MAEKKEMQIGHCFGNLKSLHNNVVEVCKNYQSDAYGKLFPFEEALMKAKEEMEDSIKALFQLESSLSQVRQLWSTYKLELIKYQNKCQIIRGWDDLFNKLTESIHILSADQLWNC